MEEKVKIFNLERSCMRDTRKQIFCILQEIRWHNNFEMGLHITNSYTFSSGTWQNKINEYLNIYTIEGDAIICPLPPLSIFDVFT